MIQTSEFCVSFHNNVTGCCAPMRYHKEQTNSQFFVVA